MNKMVKLMSSKMNDKNKLNGGQIREAIRAFSLACQELSEKEVVTLINYLDKVVESEK